MAFVAFLDTCVLFPTNLRDVILTIAEVGICQVRWSPDVLDELQRTYIKKAKVDTAKAEAGVSYLLGIMTDAFPDAMVDRRYYAHAIPAMRMMRKTAMCWLPLLRVGLTYWSRPTLKISVCPQDSVTRRSSIRTIFCAINWSLPHRSFFMPLRTLHRTDVSR